MTAVFEKSDEWGGFTIKLDPAGFLIEYHTHVEGEIDGLAILVPYGTWGFRHDTSLHAAHEEMPSNGEALAELSQSDARLPIEDRRVEVLDEGTPLRTQKRREVPPVVPTFAPLRKILREERRAEGRTSWYTFSLPKTDEDGYGKCHDLFTAMYLTHGLPHHMALWTTSNFATDENIFFAEIPEGIDVREDPFFTDLPVIKCDPPSRIGLSIMVGHLDEPQRAKLPEKRRRRWRLKNSAA